MITKKQLSDLYYKERMTLEDIGWKFDLTKGRIWQLMKQYGLQCNRHRTRRRKAQWED